MMSPITLTPSTTFSAFLPPLTLADDLRPKTACSLIFWIANTFLLHKSQTTCRLAFAKYSHWSVLNRCETGHGWGLWRIPRKAGAEGARCKSTTANLADSNSFVDAIPVCTVPKLSGKRTEFSIRFIRILFSVSSRCFISFLEALKTLLWERN